MTANRHQVAADRHKENNPVVSGTIESNNHANTQCFGPNFVMYHFTGQTCSISGYNKKIHSEEICISTGLTIWTNQITSKLQLL